MPLGRSAEGAAEAEEAEAAKHAAEDVEEEEEEEEAAERGREAEAEDSAYENKNTSAFDLVSAYETKIHRLTFGLTFVGCVLP